MVNTICRDGRGDKGHVHLSGSDTTANRAIFADAEILHVESTLSLLRLHVAFSANQAAVDCRMLEKVLKGKITWTQWERSVVHYCSAMRQLSAITRSYT
jgi:hypothetical protein